MSISGRTKNWATKGLLMIEQLQSVRSLVERELQVARVSNAEYILFAGYETKNLKQKPDKSRPDH